MVYRNVLTVDLHVFIDWAESNDIEYDVWNAEESISGSEVTELGLVEWPEVEIHHVCGPSDKVFRIK